MQISFVLVNPARAANVGAAARALKTMGFSDLIIAGSDVHLQKEASWVAHGAQDILHNVRSVNALQDIRAEFDLLIGTTARERGSARHYQTPAEIAQQLQRQTDSLHKFAIVFGCEASGLSNDDLNLCDLYSYIPLKNEYPSLNLAQAVMVYTYALSDVSGTIGLQEEMADEGQLKALKQRALRYFDGLQEDNSEKIREWLAERITQLGDRDVRMAHQLLMLLEKSRS